jgi:hypothetical protein
MVRALKDSIGKLDAGHSGSDTTRRVGAAGYCTPWLVFSLHADGAVSVPRLASI